MSKELDQKTREIASLIQELKETRDKKRSLEDEYRKEQEAREAKEKQSSLDSKNSSTVITHLREQVCQLESDKQSLSDENMKIKEEISSLKTDLKLLKDQLNDVSKHSGSEKNSLSRQILELTEQL